MRCCLRVHYIMRVRVVFAFSRLGVYRVRSNGIGPWFNRRVFCRRICRWCLVILSIFSSRVSCFCLSNMSTKWLYSRKGPSVLHPRVFASIFCGKTGFGYHYPRSCCSVWSVRGMLLLVYSTYIQTYLSELYFEAG